MPVVTTNIDYYYYYYYVVVVVVVVVLQVDRGFYANIINLKLSHPPYTQMLKKGETHSLTYFQKLFPSVH